MLKSSFQATVLALTALSIHGFAQDRPAAPGQAPAQPGVRNPADPARPDATRPDATRPDATTQPGADARSGAAANNQENLQAHIANCLLLGNQEEIALSRFALQRSQNEKVKEFARKTIEDHSQYVRELQQYASNPMVQIRGGEIVSAQESNRPDAPAGTRDAADANQPGQPQGQPGVIPRDPRSSTADALRPGTGTTRTAARPVYEGAAGDQSEKVNFEIQAVEECLRLTQQDLAKHEGEDFDMAYLGVQLGMHNGMLAKLKAAEGRTSGEFQALIQKGQQTAQQHKQHAEQLKQELKGNDSSTNSGRTGAATPGQARPDGTRNDRQIPERPRTLPADGTPAPRLPQ